MILTTVFGRYPNAKGKGSLSGLTSNTSTTDKFYLHCVSRLPRVACPEMPGLILFRRSDVYARSGSLGRSNDGGQASGDVGCSGCSSLEVSIPGVWVSHRVVLNRRRVGLSVAVSGLLTLVVLFGGVAL